MLTLRSKPLFTLENTSVNRMMRPMVSKMPFSLEEKGRIQNEQSNYKQKHLSTFYLNKQACLYVFVCIIVYIIKTNLRHFTMQ